jgi:hypothetical protein
MRSRILAALAFTGLLMTAIPLTASAHDKATCSHEPVWGYQHPNWYKGWRQKNCGSGYGYNQNYFGNGAGWQNYFGNGGGGFPFAPAYSQYEGPRYYDNGQYNNDRYNRDDGWRGGWRAQHQHWDRDHDGHRRHEHR